ncbi:hypothetical protein FB451DRAFT_1163175 [Mycena latifolia]|nr:hypothetical protein FB451DRAFT_1163175 [Mycena latifolia]
MNEASDRVSNAEAVRPVLEVYCGERYEDERGKTYTQNWLSYSAKTMSLLYPLAAQPQFRRNRVECGPPEELDTRNRSRKSMPRLLCALDTGPRLWRYPVGTRVEAGGVVVEWCLGVDVVAVMVREAAADEPRLGKFPYADS